jgi:hypothetical protein
MSERYVYIKIAIKLAAPLFDAYHQMLDINVKSQGCNNYVIDHAQTTLADSDQVAREPNIVPPLSPNTTLLSPQIKSHSRSDACTRSSLPHWIKTLEP